MNSIQKYINNLSEVKLDIGCGPNKKKGFIGVDIVKLKGVDFIIDLEKAIPLKSSIVDEIYSSHFLEHIKKPINVLNELGRILKENGKLTIKVPHYTNPYAYHFTHTTYWSSYSLNQNYLDFYTKSNLQLVSKRIYIIGWGPFNDVFNLLANMHMSIYERFFSTFVKAWEVEFILTKKYKKKIIKL